MTISCRMIRQRRNQTQVTAWALLVWSVWVTLSVYTLHRHHVVLVQWTTTTAIHSSRTQEETTRRRRRSRMAMPRPRDEDEGDQHQHHHQHQHHDDPTTQSEARMESEGDQCQHQHEEEEGGHHDHHQDRHHQKPYLILHVGPPQTEATYLQRELTTLYQAGILERDHVIYAGGYHHDDDHDKKNNEDVPRNRAATTRLAIADMLWNTSCYSELQQPIRQHHDARHADQWNNASTNTTTNNTTTVPLLLRDALLQVDCWKQTMDELLHKYYYHHYHDFQYSNQQQPQQTEHPPPYSLVVSDASASFRKTHYSAQLGRAPVDWRVLQASISPYYNIHVVLGYRRFHEWLPLAKRQWESYAAAKRFTADWPQQPQPQQHGLLSHHKGGRHVEPLFPSFFKVPLPSNLLPFAFTDSIVHVYRPFVHVTVWNLEAYRRIGVLLLQPPPPPSNNNNNNTGNQPPVLSYMSLRSHLLCHVFPDGLVPNACRYSRDTDRASETARHQTETVSLLEETRAAAAAATTTLSPWYDMLVTRAADQGWINLRRMERRRAAAAAQDFHEAILNLTLQDFPLACPSRMELELFLNKSVQMEAIVVPEFHHEEQENHRGDFWRRADAGEFCSIDVDAVLQEERWQTFFRNRMRVPVDQRVLHGDKPYFIIHVGPPKTGTTSLQSELTEQSDILLKDNYIFTGAYVRNREWSGQLAIFNILANMTCSREVEGARVRHSKRSWMAPTNTPRPSLLEALLAVDCWKAFKTELDSYQQRGHSIVISDETLSFRRSMYEDIGRAPFDWIALKETLQDDWNLRVVVTYRRFVEWLPSAKQQWERYLPAKATVAQWPSTTSRGVHIQPIFPDFWKIQLQSNDLPYAFTDYIYDNYWPYIPVAVMNMYSGGANTSIRTNFLCNILPNARHACQHSRKRDATEVETVINKSEPPPYYDMLATRAAAKGMINTSSGLLRRDAALAIQAFHEQALNLTLRDFPVVCPEPKELKAFLDKSLAKEAWLLPEFHAMRGGKAQHQETFMLSAKKGKYCSIDIERVLREEVWIQFLQKDLRTSHTVHKKSRQST